MFAYSELLSLFLIVLLVYLLQCICWASPRAIIFSPGIRGRGKRRYPGFVWNAFDIAGLLANPLPPLAPVLVVQWPAFELSPDSIQFPAKETKEDVGAKWISIPWEKLEVSHSEAKLLCNGVVAFKGSKIQVLEYVDLLEQLRRARRGQRGQIIQDWLRKSLSIENTARRVRVFTGRSLWVKILTNLQFFFLFFGVPLAFRFFGTGILWRVILVLVTISVAIALEFWTLVKSAHPNRKVSWMTSLVTVILSPVAAIRAEDAAARDLLSGFHPLAVAGAVLPEEEFRRFAAEQLRLCRFGDYRVEQYRQALQKAMEQGIKQKKLNPTDLLRPPAPEAGCIVYCPRCLAQYTKARTECTDCGYEGVTGFARG
ncbi:MAG TPA: hypothetical protein VJA94_09120 [Candidatus Angelobacter sp.]